VAKFQRRIAHRIGAVENVACGRQIKKKEIASKNQAKRIAFLYVPLPTEPCQNHDVGCLQTGPSAEYCRTSTKFAEHVEISRKSP
jgi:hypothetical protein